MLDVDALRNDIPLLSRPEAERPIYFDNACMTLKPRRVLDAMLRYYHDFPACAERSVHRLGNQATLAVEDARQAMADLVMAPSANNIAFTKNTTEAINHVTWGLPLAAGDVVLTSDKEHNSNLVPWKRRAETDGIVHDWFRTNDDGTFDEEAFKSAVSAHRKRLRLVSIVHTSNLDGITFPLDVVVDVAHDAGARVLVDAAQSVPHRAVDVEGLGVDYLAWSVHKMMGPTGVGCLYGTDEALRALHPRYLGGNTVADSRLDGYELLDPPHTLEAGLQDYAGMIGAGEAARLLAEIGPDEIHAHEQVLTKRLVDGLSRLDAITIHNHDDTRTTGGIVPFSIAGMNAHDVALYLDEAARICVRSGAHCVHGWIHAHGVEGWVRASTYAYNTVEECDRVVKTVGTLLERMSLA